MSELSNILLVEDDRHIALALQIRLGAAGYCVRIAASVAEANELLSNQAPDIAVIDINLPDGNGIALLKSFDTLCPGVQIVSIIMSASRRPGLADEALAAGASAFLEKPFPSSMLLDAITGGDSIRQAS